MLGLTYYMGGFDFFNILTGTYEYHMPIPNDSLSLSTADVNNIFKDRDGGIWLGTWKGSLEFYDVNTGRIKNYQHNPLDSASISGDIVTKVFQDRAGSIWVGTFQWLSTNNVICEFDPRTITFRNFGRADGLLGNEFKSNSFF